MTFGRGGWIPVKVPLAKLRRYWLSRLSSAGTFQALIFVFFLLTAFIGEHFLAASLAAAGTPVLSVSLEQVVSRPPGRFTQGLLFFQGRLFESTGLYGQSQLCRYPAPTSENLLAAELCLKLPENIFAEGLAELDGFLYLLTWQEGTVFKLAPQTLEVVDTYFSPGQGWGLTTAEGKLWRSDGSEHLIPHRAGDFAKDGPEVLSHDQAGPVTRLNELEFDPASGLILANVYMSCRIAAIKPKTGQVAYYLDLTDICSLESQSLISTQESVLNGLAIDEEGRLWITGKRWPHLYRISYQLPEPK
ncbi:MAG: glutaminyl-peptide cyclotransferase [Deltaproteobacteria bacterium]|nr:glutaminyl-peptide cyclotransferase [Deltaproteobacteria bacterium]